MGTDSGERRGNWETHGRNKAGNAAFQSRKVWHWERGESVKRRIPRCPLRPAQFRGILTLPDCKRSRPRNVVTSALSLYLFHSISMFIALCLPHHNPPSSTSLWLISAAFVPLNTRATWWKVFAEKEQRTTFRARVHQLELDLLPWLQLF